MTLDTNYPAVRDEDVKRIKIPLPSIEEQREIASIFFSIDSKIKFVFNMSKNLSDLFETLLNVLMTGKIRVKDIEFEKIENLAEN